MCRPENDQGVVVEKPVKLERSLILTQLERELGVAGWQATFGRGFVLVRCTSSFLGTLVRVRQGPWHLLGWWE